MRLTRTHISPRLLSLCIAGLALFGCDDGGGDSDAAGGEGGAFAGGAGGAAGGAGGAAGGAGGGAPVGDGSTATNYIGPEGGEIELPGATLVIPQGAMATRLIVTLTATDLQPEGPYTRHSVVYRLEPEDVALVQPAEIRLEIDDAPDDLALFWSESMTGFTPVDDLRRSGGKLVGRVEALGYLFAGVADPDAPMGGMGGGEGGMGGGEGGFGGGGEVIPSCAELDEVWSEEWVEFEFEVLRLTNEYRAQGFNCDTQGEFGPAGPLEFNATLRCSSRLHSQDMADQGYFEHNSLDGRTPFDRMREAGYQGGSMGENIAAGQRTPEEVVAGWMDSDGHCANIMNPNFNELGVGYFSSPIGASPFGHYWTQNFGSR
ncbi:MAG: CAP domain-containing protein [Bradymonadia bacterium]